MNNQIKKAANQFIKKELKNKVDFETVCEYLRTIGYAVIFYNSYKDNEILNKYDLTDFSKTVKAFTIFRKDLKAVFIDENSSCNDKICSLLHETAHIIFGHINEKNIKESRTMEMEADAFAYAVLNYKKSHTPLIVTAAVISTAIITSMFSSYYHNAKTPTFVIERSQISEPETISVPQHETESQTLSETVYVTPSGTKFHKQGCRYIKNKNVKEYSRTDAANKYSPCSVCEP